MPAPAPERMRRPAAPQAPVAAPAPPAPRAPAPAKTKASDFEAIFAEEETPLELEEVVAIGTDPVRAQASPTVALLGEDESFGPDPFRRMEAPPADATVAFFGDAQDLTSEAQAERSGDDSSGDLDDLFADLVKE